VVVDVAPLVEVVVDTELVEVAGTEVEDVEVEVSGTVLVVLTVDGVELDVEDTGTLVEVVVDEVVLDVEVVDDEVVEDSWPIVVVELE
jgi:hypothetical protein